MAGSPSYTIFPLGDAAVTMDIGDGNGIDEQYNIRAVALHDWLQANRFPGILDIIVAYSSVSVLYDPALVQREGAAAQGTVSSFVHRWLGQAWQAVDGTGGFALRTDGRLIRLPVCYETAYAPDMDWVSQRTSLSGEEVVAIHSAGVYRVYMIGFLPGFSYMGRLDRRLQLPRKKQPVNVIAGGVGIAGLQTGIYPLNSPGGWHIIGRTPVKQFDPAMDPPVRFQTGDYVQFYPVSAEEFARIRASEIVSPFHNQ
ncbi:MAG TPA: 5-oxoprolinase subunit PxpB [Puia sp.]|nr:5-oxoprolinase subunit PxpB [Puia sp.]